MKFIHQLFIDRLLRYDLPLVKMRSIALRERSLSYCQEAMSNDKPLRVYVVEVKGRSQFGYELKNDR
ncbi:MAG: hypothetical protein RMY63_09625 [Nostoc sp. ChiQUE01b]|nr:hypothetical protein [Nostoc sp. ChiQUE01b]